MIIHSLAYMKYQVLENIIGFTVHIENIGELLFTEAPKVDYIVKWKIRERASCGSSLKK